MVFQVQLTEIRNKIEQGQSADGLVDMSTLITTITAFVATLPPAQRAEWEADVIVGDQPTGEKYIPTVDKLQHASRHLSAHIEIFADRQKDRSLRALSSITKV